MTGQTHGWHPLLGGCPPVWANEWGEDRFGIFVGFTIEGATQLLRWIHPGTFEMGSPETEWGRTNREGPRHKVTLTRGYWLADTPVTQALWQAVMGENPSRVAGVERPVEAVSWDDCQRFCHKLNARLSGLRVRLPSEAEWEHACRAGTTTATYAGDLTEETAADILGSIAWYAANSGRVTHDVKQHQPNAWGLHDTLGGVWEWCQDAYAPYEPEPVVDPLVVGSPQAPHVHRGASWGNTAGEVRAARRQTARSGVRDDLLGLRLAHDHSPP